MAKFTTRKKRTSAAKHEVDQSHLSDRKEQADQNRRLKVLKAGLSADQDSKVLEALSTIASLSTDAAFTELFLKNDLPDLIRLMQSSSIVVSASAGLVLGGISETHCEAICVAMKRQTLFSQFTLCIAGLCEQVTTSELAPDLCNQLRQFLNILSCFLEDLETRECTGLALTPHQLINLMNLVDANSEVHTNRLQLAAAQCLMVYTDTLIGAMSAFTFEDNHAFHQFRSRAFKQENTAIRCRNTLSILNMITAGMIPPGTFLPEVAESLCQSLISIPPLDLLAGRYLENDPRFDALELILRGLSQIALIDGTLGPSDPLIVLQCSILEEVLARGYDTLIQLALPFAIDETLEYYPEGLQGINLLALDTLHNLAWSICGISDQRSSLSAKWTSMIPDLWQKYISRLPQYLTMEEEVADSVMSLLYALVKKVNGAVPIDIREVNALIKLYQSSLNADLQIKIVGFLGCLAQCQGRVDINRSVGVFLITIVSSLPRSDTEVTVEALDAIFDIYGDKDYDYDEPVFRKGQFLRHLETSVPAVQKMLREINKKHSRSLWERAEDATNNLKNFIEYKRHEAKNL